MLKNLNYFVSAYIPNKKAHSVQILKMCDELSNKYNVNLICGFSYHKKIWRDYNLKNSFKIKNLKIFNYKILNIFSKIYYLAKFKLNKKDTLFTRDVHFAFFGIFFYSKIFLELHQTYLKKNYLSFYFLIFIFKLKKIKIIFISKELLNIYKKYIGIPQNYVVAHDASDDNFKFNNHNIINSKILNVGYCGHLYSGRGIEVIIKLAKFHRNMNFNILGGFKQDKENLCKIYRIPKNVKFNNHTKYKNISNFLKNNDILIAPYQKKLGKPGELDTANYMSPLKIFEYMSAQKAIVCSDHKVLKEVLVNNINSLLCNPENFKEWFLSLERLKDKKLRFFLGKNAYKDYKNFYTWKKRTDKILYD